MEVLKPNGTRCPYKYCSNTLSRVYSQDMDQILSAGRNLPGVDKMQHCGPDEARYLWKCPRCRDMCACSICRKKKGLEPLGFVRPAKPKASTSNVGSKKEKVTPSSGGRSPSQDLIRTMKKDNVSPRRRPEPSMKQRMLLQHLKPPAVAEAPELEKIETRLPAANILERLWLYETLVRFDLLKIPARVLGNLDNLDHWTESMLQTIFERLVQSLAGIKNLKATSANSATLKRSYRPLVEACSQHLGRIDRGEHWAAARALLETKLVRIPELVDVEIAAHQRANDRTSTPVGATTDTLLSGRATRSRRLAEMSALEKVREMSRREHQQAQGSESSDEGEDGDGSSSEASWTGIKGRQRARTRAKAGRGRRYRQEPSSSPSSSANGSDEEVMSELSELSDPSDEETIDQDNARPTRPSRESRSNGRKTEKEAPRRSSRHIAKAASSNESDEEDGDIEMRTRATKRDSGSERDEVPEASRTEKKDEEEERPLEPPSFETRVAILSALVDLLVQTSTEIGHELAEGIKMAALLEKQGRDEVKELTKAHDDEMKALNQRAPSMSKKNEYTTWKHERAELERRQRYEMLDCQVHTQLLVEPHKLRTGPMGTDADGNVYWQLSEYTENMPKDTQGKWAWSLLILGNANLCARKEDQSLSSEAAERETGAAAEVQHLSNEMKSPEGEVARVSCEVPRVAHEKIWMGSNTPEGIEQLMKYLKYRLALKEHDEHVADAKKDMVAAVDVSGELATPPPPPTKAEQALRRAQRRQLREDQAIRREQVESLLKRLEFARDYYVSEDFPFMGSSGAVLNHLFHRKEMAPTPRRVEDSSLSDLFADEIRCTQPVRSALHANPSFV
ncbi:hypothetical protein FA10DRAFT_262895 [Acaromyces ingoldii]|uniref:Zinc-finger domain-containing protein n=1 Tax=Acaromyces ingoldii TaxID=215250 RepID=A0A316YD88_9BASI|nr:hypothetical protein FA10DRAFT_262895 [Acaromyces ingoldii]PWN87141.1 hypothetical protein FA10DRAFT_262895 [Acaromyces ingoldii]